MVVSQHGSLEEHSLDAAADFANSMQSEKVWTNTDGDRENVVQTAWALLCLICAGQEITGIYFRYCGLNYAAFRDIFPMWALGEYRRGVLLA
ncbi:Lupeol synthase [Morella rubra]|uniref:Lupeol synthase n=1 Tax=Morella rubra TaxID=262757 RepID=A0A6A1VJD6_9ROSI|nr:Lupeol synthase [Morella rubra]